MESMGGPARGNADLMNTYELTLFVLTRDTVLMSINGGKKRVVNQLTFRVVAPLSSFPPKFQMSADNVTVNPEEGIKKELPDERGVMGVVRSRSIEAPDSTENARRGSRHLSKDDSGLPLIIPTRWERLLAERPCLVCWSSFIISFMMMMGFSALMSSKRLQFDPNGVWDVRGDQVVQQRDGFNEARRTLLDAAVKVTTLHRWQEVNLASIDIIYEAVDKHGNVGNVLSPELIDIARRFEARVEAEPRFREYFCLKAYSASSDASECSPLSSLPYLWYDDPSLHQAAVQEGFFSGASQLCDVQTDLEPFRTAYEDASGSIPCGVYLTAEALAQATSPATTAPPSSDQCSSSGDTSFAATCLFCSDSCYGSPPCRATNVGSTSTFNQASAERFMEGVCKATPGYSPQWTEDEKSSFKSYQGYSRLFLPTDFRCPDSASGSVPSGFNSPLLRSRLIFGGPLDNEGTYNSSSMFFSSEKDAMVEEVLDYVGSSWLTTLLEDKKDFENESDNQMRIYLGGRAVLGVIFNTLLASQSIYATGSVFFVFLWIWSASGSLFLACLGMYEIVASIPIAFFLWGSVLQQGWIGFLCIMQIFVIVGIGADDIFVLLDAWKQSELQPLSISASKITRFAWAYRRARGAMFVTTSTTCIGFLAAGFSGIPSIRGFGIVACLVVLFDYLLVITFFASGIIIYSDLFEGRFWGKEGILGRYCFSGCVCLVKEGTALSTWKKYKLTILTGSTFLVFGLLMVILDSQKTFYGSSFQDYASFSGALLICLMLIVFVTVMNSRVAEKKRMGQPPELRLVEKFFKHEFIEFLNKFKYHFVAFWSLVTFIGLLLALLKLRPAEEMAQFVDPNADVQRFQDASLKFYQSEAGYYVTVHLAMGLNKDEAINRAGVDFQEPGPSWTRGIEEPLGVPQFDTAFPSEIERWEVQQEILDACDALPTRYGPFQSSSPTLVNSEEGCDYVFVSNVRVPRNGCLTGTYCWLYLVKDYVELCMGGLQTLQDVNIHEVVSSQGFKDYMDHVEAVRGAVGMGYDNQNWKDLTGFVLNEEGKIGFAFMTVNSTLVQESMPYEFKKEYFDLYSALNADMFPSVGSAFQTSDYWVWMVTERELVRSVLQAVVLSLLFAGVILVVTTGNWRVAALGLFAILAVVATVAGICVCLGWPLGIIESIAMIVVVGLSVDYSVHVIHAYNESSADTSLEKTRDAMTDMGVSLISGVFTTFGSAMFLWFSIVIFFRLFGTFLAMTVVVSILVAFTYLGPLSILLGPVGKQGDIQWPCFRNQQ